MVSEMNNAALDAFNEAIKMFVQQDKERCEEIAELKAECRRLQRALNQRDTQSLDGSSLEMNNGHS